jgi:hypothetical protein
MTIAVYLGAMAVPHISCSLIAAKSIGMLGSMAIAVNSLAGPAILQLPATYQEAGIMPTTIALVIVGLLSSFCSLHMANVVSKVPGNRRFDKEVSQIHDFYAVDSFALTLWNQRLNLASHFECSGAEERLL